MIEEATDQCIECPSMPEVEFGRVYERLLVNRSANYEDPLDAYGAMRDWKASFESKGYRIQYAGVTFIAYSQGGWVATVEAASEESHERAGNAAR